MPENKDLENIKRKFPVPQGFRELLESLAREVLRGQPPNIYEFSALFFEYLLQKQSENEGECVIDNPKLYEEFKMELFTEALKQGMVSPLVGPMLGIDVQPSPRTSYVRDLQQQQQQLAKEGHRRPSAPPVPSTPDGFYDNHKQEKPEAENKDQILHKSAAEPYNEKEDQIMESPSSLISRLSRSHEKMELQNLVSSDLDHQLENRQTRDSIDNEKFRQNFSQSIEYSPDDESKTGIGDNGADSDAGFDEGKSEEVNSEITPSKIEGPPSTGSPHGHFHNPDEAAVKIQAEIRGYLTRKHIHDDIGHHDNNNLPSEQDKNETKIATHELDNENDDSAAAAVETQPLNLASSSSSQKHRPQERVSSLDSDHNHILRDKKNLKDADADAAAAKIQAGVRGFLTRHRVHEMKHEQDRAAAKIQAGIRGHLTRKHLEKEGVKLKHPSQATHSQIRELERKSSAPQLRTPKTSQEAAAKIQAGIRGYLTRKHLNDQGIDLGHHRRVSYNVADGQRRDLGSKGQNQQLSDEQQRRQSSHFHFQPISSTLGPSPAQQQSPTSSNASLELDDAAAKIQAGIRGYLTRKHIKQQLQPRKPRPKPGHFGQQSIELYLPEDEAAADHQLQDAAVKIQAQVRGYLTRHQLAKQQEAAVKIQSAYRGFQTRQDYSPSRHHHQ